MRQKPDLLYCVGSASAQACQKATDRIPVEFAEVELDGDRLMVRPARGAADSTLSLVINAEPRE